MTTANNKAGTTIDVTVVIPTFRREMEVCEALHSVLRQEGVSVECIVLDDSPEGSARTAVSALNDPRITYILRDVPSKGRPAIARNEGAALAQGRYLYFLDDDDHVYDGALRDMVAALDARPDLGVALGWVVPFGSDAYWLGNKSEYFERAARIAVALTRNIWFSTYVLFRGTLMVNSACMIRRELFAPLGGFDATIPVYEDVDFWMRAVRRYGHLYLPRPVLHYRVGKPSLMHNLGKSPELEVVKSYAMMHRKYIREHGLLEYRALQILAKLLPYSLVRRIPIGKR
jgi:glycosyltransferase involved in cell wall biosynthesis